MPLGEVLIEFLEPTEPGAGRIGQYLEEKGEGLHHIALRVGDIDRTMEKLKESICCSGIKSLGPGPIKPG